MKAILLDLNALPLDRMSLEMLPPGELDVQIRLRCDEEAYGKLVAFFRDAGFRDGRGVSGAPALGEAGPVVELPRKP
jgi:hypothetical protein